MEFARLVIGEETLLDTSGDPAISDEGDHRIPSSSTFNLMTMPMCPTSVFEVAIDAYFERFDWFVMLMHRPSFKSRTKSILGRTTWEERELGDVVLVLIVSVLGIQCAKDDVSWPGHQILDSHQFSPTSVIQSMLREVGVHFYDVLSNSQIQSYQILMLLTIYHTYFGSFQFAWNISGIPARAAYGLGLHREKLDDTDAVTRQVGIRCWNHAIVGELFASMIYGRSSTLDPSRTHFREVEQLRDEPNIPEDTSNLPVMAKNRGISILTFHTLKYRLYSVIWETSQAFDSLHLGHSISVQNFKALTRAVRTADSSLQRYRDTLPAVFDFAQWGAQEPWEVLNYHDTMCTMEELDVRKKLALQGIILQVLHDSAIIFVHRPLLECRVSSPHPSFASKPGEVPDSLRVSMEAALRISRTQIGQFNHHLALSFLLLQMFAAGVILCVPPLCLPYSKMANESKAGVLRIISASRALKSTNNVARHTDHLLTNLYQKIMQREMDITLDSQNQPVVRSAQKEADNGPERRFPNPTALNRQQYRDLPTMQPSRNSEQLCSPLDPMNDDLEGDFTNSMETGSIHQDFGSSDDLGMSFLQFGSFRQDNAPDASLNQDLDEAFGAFQQST